MNTPNFAQPFFLELDACDYGLGAVLLQEYAEKKFVIAYASRTLSAAERKYGATEKEALAIVWATKHFRPYIEGVPLTIRSDCKALQWLKEAKDPYGRLARWAMQLAAFNIIEIQHRPGKTNSNADALSRYPLEPNESCNLTVNSIETAVNIWEGCTMLDDISSNQLRDPHLRPIMEYLQSPSGNHAAPVSKQLLRIAAQLTVIDGILYKISQTRRYDHQRPRGSRNLVVIPGNMQRQLLEWAHDHPTSGHSGRSKTLYRLTSRVYWATIRRDVDSYIKQCHLCQQFKYCNRPNSTPLQVHLISEPWHTIGLDIMGPFPPTQRQKQYLLVVVDYFTRWIEVFPMRTTTGSDIANVLVNEVICR
ncbi:unnamed protein product, partial [Didymodactylos carnosus]